MIGTGPIVDTIKAFSLVEDDVALVILYNTSVCVKPTYKLIGLVTCW
jgi:hypothetical protein